MDVTNAAGTISIEPLREAGEADWSAFLAKSANATLFHDLRFLAYHPPGRHRFHHLVLKRAGKLVALLPGGLTGPDERPTFCSPVGASIGGFIAPTNIRAETALALTQALQEYAVRRGWAGINITLPPACYSDVGDLFAFALFCRGFRLQHRWLCHVLTIPAMPTDGYAHMFRSNQIAAVRAARRNNLVGVERGVEGLHDFIGLFNDTYARHRTTPTHSIDEIRDIMERMPKHIRLSLAFRGTTPVAGLLHFHVTPCVVYTFYICSSAEHASENGAAFLVADLLEKLARKGARYLDLGPSASDMNFNKGVTFFKEGLGAGAQCRDRWRWDAPA